MQKNDRLAGFVSGCNHETLALAAESAKQASTIGMRRNAPKGERFIKFLNGRGVVFICAKF